MRGVLPFASRNRSKIHQFIGEKQFFGNFDFLALQQKSERASFRIKRSKQQMCWRRQSLAKTEFEEEAVTINLILKLK
jgi:hypothetical protein